MQHLRKSANDAVFLGTLPAAETRVEGPGFFPPQLCDAATLR